MRNALAALAAAAEAGVEPGALREALSAFRGVKRRLEIRGEGGGVTVYDDFAHHPTAVAATLAALRALGGGGRLVAVFEPRSYTAKTRAFQEGFARAFAGADRVIVSAAHLPGKVPEDQRLSEAELVAGIGRLGTDASFIPTVDAIVEALVAEVRPGDRSPSSPMGALAASTTSCSEPSKPPRAPEPPSRPNPLEPARCPCYNLGSFIPSICLLRCVNELPAPPGSEARSQLRRTTMKRELLALLGLGVLTAAPLLAQEPAASGQKPDEKAKEEESVRRAEEVTVESASKVETKLVDAPATMSVVTSRDARRPARPEHGDTPALRPGGERHPDLGPRHQPDDPAGHVDPRHVAARDGRRALDLPRLLRPRPVGPRALADVGRDQADRGGARPGLRGLGRQRADRRRQHHHQDAAREPRGSASSSAAGSSTATRGRARRRAPATSSTASFSYANAINDTWSYRLSAGYFNSDPYSRPVGTVPLDCHPLRSTPAARRRAAAVPGGRPDRRRRLPRDADQPRGASRTTAPASRSSTCASTRTVEQRGPHHLRGRLLRHRGHHPHRHRALPTSRAAPTWPTAESATRKGALRVNAFGNFLDVEAPNLLAHRPRTPASPIVLELQDPDLRPRGRQHERAGRASHPDLRRQPAAATTSTSRSRQGEDRNEFGAYFQESSSSTSSASPWAAAWTSSATSTTRSSRRASASCSSRRPTSRSGRPTTARSVSPSVINNYLDQNIIPPRSSTCTAAQAAPRARRAPAGPAALLPAP